jgi:predicted Rossmann fold nucleotide-binding protein DprA/Smf involved in DNA uptake
MGIVAKSATDRRLLKAAAKFASPEQLSEAVNGQLTPAQAIDRVKTLLASQDVYSEVEQRRLLLLQMAEFMDYMQEQAQDANNDKAWAALNRTFKLVSDQIERTNINIDDVSTKLGRSHAQYYVQGYMQGFTAILDALRERGLLALEGEEVKELSKIGLEQGIAYIDLVTVDDDE